MVSTRRSRSAGGESEQITSAPASQEDVSSMPSKQTLEPITEEPPQQQQQQQKQPAPTPQRRRRLASQQQQQAAQVDDQGEQTEQLQQQQQDQPEPQQQQAVAHQQHGRRQQQQQQQQHHQSQQQHVDVSSDEDDDDLDFDGDGVLQNLAAAIRSGFQSQSHQQKPQQQQPTGLQAAAAAAAAAGRSSGRELDDAELQQLRWRPQTGLQMPARAAAAVALTKPKHHNRKRHQQQQDELAGALVDTAAADDGSAEQAGAAAASKDPALSKALRAPTLDAAVRTKEAKQSAPDTAGGKWFDLPAPKITEDLKRDLRLLRLRGAYDPKRFYKSFDNTKFPKYFAVGTVVDDPLEQNNLSKGQRRATLTEQLLVDTELTHTRKRRFNKLQEDSQKWSKAKKRKTSQPRKTPSKHRPKH